MNKERRKRLAEAVALLTQAKEKFDEVTNLCEQAKSLIEDVATEERDYYDNMPENMQSGDKGTRADEVASALEAIDLDINLDLDDVISTLEDAQQ